MIGVLLKTKRHQKVLSLKRNKNCNSNILLVMFNHFGNLHTHSSPKDFNIYYTNYICISKFEIKIYFIKKNHINVQIGLLWQFIM